MTDQEKEALAHHVTGLHSSGGREMEARTDVGRHLREIRDQKLYREDLLTGKEQTFEQFVLREMEQSESWAYERIDLADVADDLTAQDGPPVAAASHAAVLVQLRHPEPETRAKLRARAQTVAHEQATGRRPKVGDIEQAVAQVRAEAIAAEGDVEQLDTSSTPSALEGIAQALGDHGGLTVAVRVPPGQPEPEGTIAKLFATVYVPVGADGAIASLEAGAGPRRGTFSRVRDLDDVSDLVWSIADQPGTDSAWGMDANPFVATLHPDRLTQPRERVKRGASQRERTVIVAPAVDFLDPEVPLAVSRRIIETAGDDTDRRYLVMTAHADRAWEGWPANVYVVAEARETKASVKDAVRALRSASAPTALVVRDLAEPIPKTALRNVDWILVRGKGTRQKAFDSIQEATGPEQVLDIERAVRARFSGYPALPATPKSSDQNTSCAEAPDREARVAVTT